jgi:hypothetical protein
MSIRFAVTSALFVLTLAAAAAQVPGQVAPVMPGQVVRPGQDAEKGTAVLRGYVTDAQTGSPIRRAMVRAMSQDPGGGSGMATTDADGRFEIRDMRGGRYNLSVMKAGYVSMSYGQRRPEQQGTVLEILDGAVVEKIAFSLPRGGVVTGTVLDEFGDPVAGVTVNTLRYRFAGGGRRLVPSGGGQTDDRGVYRIYGLVPGEYFVSATLRAQPMIMGPGPMSSSPSEGYAPTYYPGTPNAAEATRVTVRAAQETTNISLALVSARLARVSGRAVNSRGAPVVQGMVMAMPTDPEARGLMMSAPAMTGADGSFQLPGLAPGNYNINVRPRGMPSPGTEFATMRITVGPADIDGLLLMTAPGAVARGVITTDLGTAPPVLPEQVNIIARPASPDVMVSIGDAKVHEDWTFEISDLSESRILGGNVAQPGWAVKAVYHNGQDVTDVPVEFVPGSTVDGFTVVLTQKMTELSGQVAGEHGKPDTDATIVIFSDNPDRWTFMSRYLRTARPNQDGRYTLRGLPPHDYLVVAVKELEPGQFQDPEFLESIRPQATRVSLGEGESRVQDLKIARQ